MVVNLAGGVDRNTFYFSGGSIASDSLRAPLKSQTGARNVIYSNDVSMAYPITAVEHYQDQDVGDGVCMSGASSNPGYKCGTIKYIDFQQPVVGPAGQTKTVTHLWETSFSTVAGDSGAPVFGLTTDRAFGIATGRDTSEGSQLIYSSIDFVVNDMQVRLCLTAACS